MAVENAAAARTAVAMLAGLLVATVASAIEPAGFTQESLSPQVTLRVPQGTYLDADAVVYNKLYPDPDDPQAAHLNISLVTGKVILETDEGEYTYHGYMYKDNKDGGSVNTFGPTMRFSPPAYPTVDFYNELTLPVTPDFPESANAWRDTTYTNLHQHGWWAYHGVAHIETDQPYTGGDNVFFELGPKKNVTDPPSYNHYNYTIGPYHLPGNYWYHPHKHQATALQTQTAAGNSIIDGEGTFLVSERGCDTILGMLLTAQERIVMIQALFFQPSPPDNTSFGNLQSIYDNPGYEQIAENSNVGDPVCCNETRTGYEYNMTSQNFPLINGIYQPIITLQAGVYQRWRMLYAGFKYWQDLTILYEDSDELAPCDLQLISKDGIYIMDLPRTIEHVTLASANRADILIKCNGTVGDRYRLAAGQYPSFGPDWDITTDGAHFTVPNMATIELTDPSGANPSLMIDLDVPEQQKACTPLRPSYVADLRDPVIQEHGIHPLRQQLNAQNEVLKGGCTLNGRNWTFPTDLTNPPMVMQMGATVEIQYKNDQFHPVHLHESPQQITTLDMRGLYNQGLNISWTSYFEVGDWHDTIRIPNLADPAHFLNGTTTTTRLQPGPFSGYSVIHCHYLMHEDRGCMKVVQWRCPGTNPGANGSIEYPCPGGFTFAVGGDFVQENELYYGVPQFSPPPPNPFLVPAPAPALAATAAATSATAANGSATAGRRLMTEGAPAPAPGAVLTPLVAPIVLQDSYSEEFNYSIPACTCTDPDMFTGRQYCFRLGANGAVDAQCHYCLELSFGDEACNRAGLLPNSVAPSAYYFCSEIVELPAGLQMQGQSLSANGLGLSCTNVYYDPHPYALAPAVTPGAPTCTCKDAGPGWGVTGAVICWTIVDGSIPDTNCVPPAEYDVCSVQLPIVSIGNMTDGSGKVCKATGGGAGVSPAASLAPSSSTTG